MSVEWNITEWVIFILFNIALNVFFQVLAWKIGIYLGNRGEKNDK